MLKGKVTTAVVGLFWTHIFLLKTCHHILERTKFLIPGNVGSVLWEAGVGIEFCQLYPFLNFLLAQNHLKSILSRLEKSLEIKILSCVWQPGKPHSRRNLFLQLILTWQENECKPINKPCFIVIITQLNKTNQGHSIIISTAQFEANHVTIHKKWITGKGKHSSRPT